VAKGIEGKKQPRYKYNFPLSLKTYVFLNKKLSKKKKKSATNIIMQPTVKWKEGGLLVGAKTFSRGRRAKTSRAREVL
jgi:hypothetical protein